MKVLELIVIIIAAMMPVLHMASCLFGEFPGMATVMLDVIVGSIMYGLARKSWREMKAEQDVERHNR
jgi:hypothetical protein